MFNTNKIIQTGIDNNTAVPFLNITNDEKNYFEKHFNLFKNINNNKAVRDIRHALLNKLIKILMLNIN